MKYQLSLILPCFNEADAIPRVLQKLIRTKTSILHSTNLEDIEIIVVDDGSTDRSYQLLQQFSEHISVIQHKQCQGYGKALKTGFNAANGNLIGFYDLDDTCQPEDLIAMVNAAIEKDIALVCGNRMQNDSEMPMVRWAGNWTYKTLTRSLLKSNVGDCCSGFRVFHSQLKNMFTHQLPDDLNFSLAMTVTVLRQGFSYLEVPIQYKERMGHSKLNPFRHGPLFLLTLLVYCLSPRYSAKTLTKRFPIA